MVLKIHLYFKKYQLKRVEITDGVMTIRLDPRFAIYKNGKLVAVFNPISKMMLPLHPDLVVYHYR
jgi:hypothetical protein